MPNHRLEQLLAQGECPLHEFVDGKTPPNHGYQYMYPIYAPLNRNDLAFLLKCARDSMQRDNQGLWAGEETGRILSRIGRAVPEIACPEQTTGPVAQRGYELNVLYIAARKSNTLGTLETLEAVWQLLLKPLFRD